MAILPILTEPDRNLRMPTYHVESVDDGVRKMMHDFLETMYHDNGIGLAAIQVNCHKKIFVIDLQHCDDEERPAGFFPLFIANPQIIEHSSELVSAEEGCLSIPEQTVEVARPRSVTLKFLNYNNQEQVITSNGWLARVIQHENDHLDGRLIIDYLSRLKRARVQKRLKEIKKQKALSKL